MVLGRSLFFAFLLALALPAQADPLTMFLFGAAKQILSAARPDTPPQAPASLPQSTVYPGTVIEPALVRRVIDDSFVYLTQDQREEVFQALHAELMKPENFAVRAPMLDHFIQRALQVREAQLQLTRLSSREKQDLAATFRKEIQALPPEEVAPLREVLSKGLLPVPPDLNRLLLTQLD